MSKATMDLNSIEKALNGMSGVDFSGRSLKLDSANDAQPIVEAIDACSNLNQLTLTGNTLGVAAARAIGQALRKHPELTVASWADIFTGRLTNEIPLALDALSEGLIAAGARLSSLDLSDNAFGPCGVEAVVKLLRSDVCAQLQELRLNNNGMGIGGAKILAAALEATPRALRVFVGGRNRLENDGATALAAQFQKMCTLEEIVIPQNGIYHAGVRALAEAFKRNPGLAAINLNDNTVGPKGAAALAAVLPGLSQLRSLNCGDCLLRSKGALELANSLRDHTQLENVDLSHNEIGREACLAVADAIGARPADAARLRQVVLAGNSLGGAASKQAMRDKLGDCAQLSGDEDVSGSESEEETDSDDGGGSSQDTEDSAPEDAQHVDTAQPGAVVLDRSGTKEIMSEAARFIKEPTLDNFMKLGANAADVLEAHVKSLAELESDTEVERTIEALLCVCGLAGASEAADRAARRLCRAACERAGATLSTWPLANTLLKGLGLIKSENKDYKIRWLLPSCYAVVAREMSEPYFPAGVRDTLQFFIASKRATLAPETRAALERHQALFV